MNSNEQDISTIAKIKEFFIDLIFPSVCVECGKFSPRPLCAECRKRIKFQDKFRCAFCRSATQTGLTCPFDRREHTLSQLISVLDYEENIVRRLIKSFKYGFIKELGKDLGLLIVEYINKSQTNKIISLNNTVIIPVPLSGYRLRWRGFNQSKILSENISRTLNLPLNENSLKRRGGFLDWTGRSRPQADILDRESRLLNVRNIFYCNAPEGVKGKSVLLIDDVSTTGATLDECARVLKSAGALNIIGLVLAHG